MDRKKLTQLMGKLKIKVNRKVAVGLGVLAVVALVGGGVASRFMKAAPVTAAVEAHGEKSEHGETAQAHGEKKDRAPASEHDEAEAKEEPKTEEPVAQAAPAEASPGLIERYRTAWNNVQRRVDEIRASDEENRRLKLENVNLRLKVENLMFNCRAREASDHAKTTELRLSKETLSAVGRTLESIEYKIPTHLMPAQLYTLAVSYFKGGEAEKAAVILTHLTGLADNDVFKGPKNYLMTGVAWYRLENYALADQYFDKVLNGTYNADTASYFAQARLWRALVAQKTDQHSKSQYWMRELVDYHPLSTEAAWVNRHSKEAVRAKARNVAAE
jgi:hypothetical protein